MAVGSSRLGRRVLVLASITGSICTIFAQTRLRSRYVSAAPIERSIRSRSFVGRSQDLLKLRGGKKVPVKREDLSDEGYDWWLQKAEFERELYLRGDLAADAKIDDNDVKEFQDNIKAEERRKREEYLEGKVKADPGNNYNYSRTYDISDSLMHPDFSYTVPSDLDFEKHPENRNVFLQDEIPQDEDHWTRDMFEALEYGLRKHGTAWTRILRSKKGRKVFRFMDQ
eukprot:1394840-Amorphochlora_amoeboformis.AAC.2